MFLSLYSWPMLHPMHTGQNWVFNTSYRPEMNLIRVQFLRTMDLMHHKGQGTGYQEPCASNLMQPYIIKNQTLLTVNERVKRKI